MKLKKNNSILLFILFIIHLCIDCHIKYVRFMFGTGIPTDHRQRYRRQWVIEIVQGCQLGIKFY